MKNISTILQNKNITIILNVILIFLAGLIIFKNSLFYTDELVLQSDIKQCDLKGYNNIDGEFIPNKESDTVEIALKNVYSEGNKVILDLNNKLKEDATISLNYTCDGNNKKTIATKSVRMGKSQVVFVFDNRYFETMEIEIKSLDKTHYISFSDGTVNICHRGLNIFQNNSRYFLKLFLIFICAVVISLLIQFLGRKNKVDYRKRERDSNIELLRIICMIAIVLHHCVVHGGAVNMNACNNKVLAFFFLPIGKICFVTFIAISMWFLVDGSFNFQRFLNTWCLVLFYSVILTFICFCVGKPISIKQFASSFLPIAGNSHGFAAAYLLFYLIYPFVHLLMDQLSKKNARIILALAFYAQIGSQIIGNYNGYTQDFSSEIGLFIFCFILSYNLKKWPMTFEEDKKFNLLIFITVWVGVVQANLMAYVWNNSTEVSEWILRISQNESALLMILGGYALFFCFKNIKLKNNRLINSLASYTFGVLLIHDHNFFRSYFWEDIVILNEWYYSKYFILILLLKGLAIFYVCCVIEYIRKQIIKKQIWNSKIGEKIKERVFEVDATGK